MKLMRTQMTENAAKGFGRAAARTQADAVGTTKDDCEFELADFNAKYGYEYSIAFIRGYWDECLALLNPKFYEMVVIPMNEEMKL